MAWHAARWRQRPPAAITPNQANRRVLVPKRPPVPLPVFVMDFDGATSARLPQPWRPYSKNFDIRVRTLLKGAYGDFGRIIDSGNNARHLVATASSIQWRYPTQPNATLDFLAFQTHTQNAVYDTALNGNNANGLPILNTSGAGTGDSQGSAPSDWADGLGIDTVGSNVGQAASFFEGYIARLYAIDRSPIQGRPYMPGNGARHVVLNNGIVLSGSGGWEIEWAGIWTGGNRNLCGGPTNDDFIRLRGETVGTAPNTIQLKIGGSFTAQYLIWDQLAIGEQYTAKLVHPPGSDALEMYVNGVLRDSRTNSTMTTDLPIAEIGAAGGGGTPSENGEALANFQIRQTGTGETWFWALNEGSGSAAINTGNTAGGATDYDGVWSAVGWLDDLPENSFYWPMNEGAGTSFLAYTYPGNIRAPAWDMPITGTGNWEEPIANGARVNI